MPAGGAGEAAGTVTPAYKGLWRLRQPHTVEGVPLTPTWSTPTSRMPISPTRGLPVSPWPGDCPATPAPERGKVSDKAGLEGAPTLAWSLGPRRRATQGVPDGLPRPPSPPHYYFYFYFQRSEPAAHCAETLGDSLSERNTRSVSASLPLVNSGSFTQVQLAGRSCLLQAEGAHGAFNVSASTRAGPLSSDKCRNSGEERGGGRQKAASPLGGGRHRSGALKEFQGPRAGFC